MRVIVIISAGGVSVGEEDYVKDAVEKVGSMAFWKVAIKPGKPLAFGHVAGTPFIGLPGNPASVFVDLYDSGSTVFIGQPGSVSISPRPLKPVGSVCKAGRNAGGLPAWSHDSMQGWKCIHNQSSGVLSSACWGDVFVVQQKAANPYRVGDLVDVLPYALYKCWIRSMQMNSIE